MNLTSLVESELRDQWTGPEAPDTTRTIELQTRLAPDVRVIGVTEQLHRLLNNLLKNAYRQTDTTVTITLNIRGDDVVLTIADNGPGIPGDDRERVFGRFTRLDTARSRDAGGTGLGLAIARDIANSHGGTLEIDDSPRGAAFMLRLPLAKPDHA